MPRGAKRTERSEANLQNLKFPQWSSIVELMTRISLGFTLIEVLVVMAIIGMLSSVTFVFLSKASIQAKDTARISNVRSLKTALELYYSVNGGYPTSNNSTNGDVLLNDSILIGKLVPNYIPSMPPLLVADGDRYFANGATSGVQPNGYDMLIYIGATDSWCRAGTLPDNTGDWGIPTVCKF